MGSMLRDVGAIGDSQRADGSFRQFVTGARLQRTVGVEEWFNAAGLAEPKRPLWKKMSIDVAWVYPAALIFSVVLAPLLVKIPLGIRVLTSIAAVTVVMQFVVMPIRKRIEPAVSDTAALAGICRSA